MNAMDELLKHKDKETFDQAMESLYGLTPGMPRYEAALLIWKQLLSSQR
jgi:hypothetical protein